MKVTLDIPDSSRAVNVVVLFSDNTGGGAFSSFACSPADGLVLRLDNSGDGSFEEVLPGART